MVKQTKKKMTLTKTTETKYVILQETSEEEFESWMYFIKLNGNEKNLLHLKSQLDQVEWKIYEGFSTFDLDLDHLISEQTAKEMIKVELNVYFHRKFDGILKRIDFGFKEKDNNKKKIKRVFIKLGYGFVDKYIDQEDISDDEGSDSCSGDDNNSSYTVSSTDDTDDDVVDDDLDDGDDDEDVEDVKEEEEEESEQKKGKEDEGKEKKGKEKKGKEDESKKEESEEILQNRVLPGSLSNQIGTEFVKTTKNKSKKKKA